MRYAYAEPGILAILAALFWSPLASADTGYMADPSPAVTLELCGDVDIDEVQEAIAIEYQGQDDGKTMVTVSCTGTTATVRVVGPSHPRGRIVDVDLTGVDPVAMPRTIALLASELWTAPSAPAVGPEPIDYAEDEVAGTATGEHPWGRSYRHSLAIGVAATTAHRDIVAGGFDGTETARGSFSAVSLKVDWPVFSRLGVFYTYTQSSSRRLQGHEELNSAVEWRKGEGGLYVPLWEGRFRLDAQVSGGNESYTPVRRMSRNDAPSAIIPDYEFFSLGAELSYALDDKVRILGWGTSYGVITDEGIFQTLTGSRTGIGMSSELGDYLRIDGRAEAIHLEGDDSGTGLFYTDDVLSLALGLHYIY